MWRWKAQQTCLVRSGGRSLESKRRQLLHYYSQSTRSPKLKKQLHARSAAQCVPENRQNCCSPSVEDSPWCAPASPACLPKLCSRGIKPPCRPKGARRREGRTIVQGQRDSLCVRLTSHKTSVVMPVSVFTVNKELSSPKPSPQPSSPSWARASQAISP